MGVIGADFCKGHDAHAKQQYEMFSIVGFGCHCNE